MTVAVVQDISLPPALASERRASSSSGSITIQLITRDPVTMPCSRILGDGHN
jgi:hypothetical protein